MKKILALLSLLIFMVACSSSDTPVKETKGISTSRRTNSSSIGSMILMYHLEEMKEYNLL